MPPPPSSLRAKVRPVTNPSLERAGLAGAARVYVGRDSLANLTGGIENGRLCYVCKSTSSPSSDGGEQPLRREATLWSLLDKNVNPNIVMVTRAFRDACGFGLGDVVVISLGATVPGASLVEAREVPVPAAATGEKGGDKDKDKEKSGGGDLRPAHYGHWEHALGDYLERAEDIFPGMVFEGVCHGRQRRAFKVVSVNGSITDLGRYSSSATQTRILPPESSSPPPPSASALPSTQNPSPGMPPIISSAPGLTRQVAELNAFLAGFSGHFTQRGELCSVAAVVHGAAGTGKTFLLDRVAATGWGRVFRVRPADKSAAVRDAFKQARAQQPAVVLLDDLHRIIRRDRAGYDAVLEVLEDELDQLAAETERLQARPRVVVLASCTDHLADVPPELQKRERFREHILLPVPSAEERLEILRHMDVPLPADSRDAQLAEIAKRTHAFSPGDLRRLLDRALHVHWTRVNPRREPTGPGTGRVFFLSASDFESALTAVRPSTMRGIDLKPPTVYWRDIGGQDAVKKALKRMLHLTTTSASDPVVRRLVGTVPKGILLYGPPGCSKTLSAQAVATESGFNFFSVKGAELLNMYVGESERALRQLFARAAAASPSIVFFDEIDSIGGQRGGSMGSSSSSGSGARSQSAVNMITTLLTEMDGFETLTGVLIMAATNRPEALDPALLRPGRFDQVLYVGPPDRAAREAAFRVHLRDKALAGDVDLARLADATEGNSGADIKHICALAGLSANDRYQERRERRGGEGVGEGMEVGGGAVEGAEEERESEEDWECIRQEDLEGAVAQTPKLVTRQMIEGYERWQREFRPTP